MNAHTLPEDLSIAAATPILRDHRWQELTAAANQTFRDGAVAAAGKLYSRAFEEAERLFAMRIPEDTAVPLPVILNIACHNLAQFAAQAGDEAECRRLLIHTFERLIDAAQCPATPIRLRIGCMQSLKHTLAELAEHLDCHAASEAPIEMYIARLRETAAIVRHAAAHVERARNPRCCGHCGLAN